MPYDMDLEEVRRMPNYLLLGPDRQQIGDPIPAENTQEAYEFACKRNPPKGSILQLGGTTVRDWKELPDPWENEPN